MKGLGTVLAVLVGLVVLPLVAFFAFKEHTKAAAQEKQAAAARATAAANAGSGFAPGVGGGSDIFGQIAGAATKSLLGSVSDFLSGNGY